ncbi:hypothetical protein AAMO2058_000926600 [Amorphochlora amoebiformis]
MELHQSEKRDTKSSAVRISVRSDDRKDDSKIAANESQISLHQPHTSASNPKEAMKENKSKEKHTIERPALAYSYECKARVCSALKCLEPTPLGIFWWNACNLVISTLKAAKDEKNGEPEIAQVMDQAEKAWSDVVDRDTLRENRVNLKRLEIEIYRSIHKLNVKLGRVSFANPAEWDNNEVLLFWYRYFGGQNLSPIPVDRFTRALWAHICQETKELVATQKVFDNMIRHFLEFPKDSDRKFVSLSIWDVFIKRYGPFQNLYKHIQCLCNTDGYPRRWVMLKGSRNVANEVVNQGALKWIIRLGKLERNMAFVMTYSTRTQNIHTPIIRRDEFYCIQGERERKFDTLRDLAIDTCQRMEWYHAGYTLKEEKDAWSAYNAKIAETRDPTSPFYARSEDSKSPRALSTSAETLQWLDDPDKTRKMTRHLISTIKPEDEKASKKILDGVFTNISSHLRKQSAEIAAQRNELRRLKRSVRVYEGDPAAIKDFKLPELRKIEKTIHNSLRNLSFEIENIYARTLTFPNEFLCPINQKVFQDPVITKDGHTYERKAIEKWFRHHDTSPMTNVKLTDKSLTPNISLRNSILAFKAKHKLVNSKGVPYTGGSEEDEPREKGSQGINHYINSTRVPNNSSF